MTASLTSRIGPLRAMNLPWTLFQQCLRHPKRVAIEDDRRTYTSAELIAGAMHVAAAIRAHSGTSTVALLIPTSGAFAFVAMGGWFAGKTIVPLNYLLKPDELNYVIDDSGTDLIIASREMVETLGIDLSGRSVVYLEDLAFDSVPEMSWPSAAPCDSLALLLYTSGTSGRPKGVMLTHANLLANIRQCQSVIHLRRDDVMLGVLPQFHTFGLTVLTLMPLLLGIKVVYTARFVPNRIVKLFRAHTPRFFIGIPSMYNALLNVKSASPEDFAHTEFLISGGEPLPAAVAERFLERFGAPLVEGYGMTECSPVTHLCLPSDHRPGSIGKPLPGIVQRIVDPATGEELSPNTDGELRLKGPNIMQGYYHLPEQTAAAFDEQGYLRTGDMARADASGFTAITGRLKEMMIVAGENVFPREIEEVLNAHRAVHASGVVGQTDPSRGEVPVAFVELAEDQDSSEEHKTQLKTELKAWCRDQLAGYKSPREIHFVDALPRNPTGKVQRRELAALLTTS